MDKKNVLLVDDDNGVNFLNRFLLNNSGFELTISTALHGQDALKVLSELPQCPDVIFLDINMPRMDGFGFLDRFKETKCYSTTKVYMLTSSLQNSDRERAASYSCVVDYLEKPLTELSIQKVFS